VTLPHGDCRDVKATLGTATVDAIVTDPPYELGFMGRRWDASGIAYDHEVWKRAYDVLKPGGHLLAFGGTRTWHRLACAIEDAGFEVRDSIAWMYGSGFPKSLDVSKAIDKAAGVKRQVIGSDTKARSTSGKSALPTLTGSTVYETWDITAPATDAAREWSGWGTALKPAHEPIVVARKPLMGTVAENVLTHGTGALNIDGSRIGTDGATKRASQESGKTSAGWTTGHDIVSLNAGRWPANVILDESQAAELDRQSGVVKGQVGMTKTTGGHRFITGDTETVQQFDHGVSDTGGASRFFYVPKANASERPKDGDTAHPTVKPLDLMRYLVKLVTPPGGTVLEPFAGSGTTLEACVVEGFHVVGIELTEDYLPLIVQRLSKPIEQVLW
jgi:site-specific DNA-methyltransferase (adenine-specific)